MYQKILNDPLVFGPEISSEAQSILTGLLTRDPTRRLGVNGAEEIKKHPFFVNHIDFELLARKKIHPPFKPSVASPVDVSNFDTVFTTEAPVDSFVEDSNLSQTVQARFTGKPFHMMRATKNLSLVQDFLTTVLTFLSAQYNLRCIMMPSTSSFSQKVNSLSVELHTCTAY